MWIQTFDLLEVPMQYKYTIETVPVAAFPKAVSVSLYLYSTMIIFRLCPKYTSNEPDILQESF